MSRLPIPGQDSGTWGDILNDYLSQSLKPDGTLQDNSVTSNAVAPNSITNAQIASDAVNAASIADGSITNSLIADGTIQEVKLSSTVQTKLNQTAPVTSVNTKTGVVTLDQSDIGLSDVDNTSDATKNAATATLTNKTITSAQLTGTTAVPTGNNLYIYNTADQTTNYERAGMWWDTNILNVGTSTGGTGAVRSMYLTAGTSNLVILRGASSTSGRVQLSGSTTATTSAIHVNVTGTFTGTSGIQSSTAIQPTINQTSTASYTALLVNPTETATGSGAKLLADFQVGGTSKTRIDNTGWHYLSTGAGMTSYNTSDETTNYERVRQYWNSNVYTIAGEFGGTGITREVRIGIATSAGASTLANYLGFYSGTPYFKFVRSTSQNSPTYIDMSGFANTGSSGGPTFLAVNPTLNQSGTAGYTALLVNPTETATGSGAKRLLDLQVGGTTKFNVDNTGIATVAAVGTAAGSLVSVDGAQTLTNKTLTNPLVNKILDINGNSAMLFNATANAVNYAFFVNGATGNSVSMRANGSDTNIPFALFSKGSGQVQLRSDTNGFIFTGDSVASGVNYVGITNAATGSGPIIVSTGSDTNIDLTLKAKGTGNLLIPSGTGSLQYNTTDQTTNYERARQYWNGSTYTITTENGGTGTLRSMVLNGGASFVNLTGSGITMGRSGTGNANIITAVATLTASSGSQAQLNVAPIINQSGTANYIALLVNPSETATGSGTKLLADFQVGSTSKFSIRNNGIIRIADSGTPSDTTVSGGYLFSENGELKWKGSSGTVTTIAPA